jgi:hypothetical protein
MGNEHTQEIVITGEARDLLSKGRAFWRAVDGKQGIWALAPEEIRIEADSTVDKIGRDIFCYLSNLAEANSFSK